MSRMASAIWSQTLSGWPSVTDSEVIRSEGELIKVIVISVCSSFSDLVTSGSCLRAIRAHNIIAGGDADRWRVFRSGERPQLTPVGFVERRMGFDSPALRRTP